ncbi:MAG: ubiquinol-cytochrome c reductase iron-sulfur subunit [Alphaproteobacteria bacterium]
MSDDIIQNDDFQEEKAENPNRREFIILTASAMTVVGAGAFLWPLVDSLNPAADVLALGTVEVDLAPIKPGQSVTVMWQGKPVFIRNRTDAEIQAAKETPLNELKHPESDENRTKPGHEHWLVMVGICTHLGCIPLGQQGDYNGWFCPCHGSQYDTAGRIRKGPAPTNLAIPKYEFLTDTKIKIG